MANKRTLKKQIRLICGDVAGECILVKSLIDGADKSKLNNAIVKTAELQEAALSRTNVSFDKRPQDFPNQAEYRKASHKYFAQAYKSLTDGFNKQLGEIVKEMNSAIPKKDTEK